MATIDTEDPDVIRLLRAEEAVRRAHAHHQALLQARNEVIIDLRAEGWPRNEIARTIGVNPSLITKIIAG